jgi:regulator of cell morphogenesis and NO signaling
MTLSSEATVGELASQYPSTVRVFRQLGIEFCCGGRRTLGEACYARGLSYGDVAAALTAAMSDPGRPTGWPARPVTDLITHIVETFHEPLRLELPRLHAMAIRLQGHGDAHRRALAVVLHELARFQGEREVQMASEERDVFPLIARIAERPGHSEEVERFARLRAIAEADHADAGHTLRLLRQITDGYRSPDSACPTLRELYRGLEELDLLMRRHAHLENNVLFPRAEAIAAAGFTRS